MRLPPSRRRGAAGQQYAIIVGLVAAVAIAAIASLGTRVGGLMGRVGNTLIQVGNGAAGTATGSGASGNGIVDRGDGVRRWSDDTAAASCHAYRYPSDGHSYSGLTGDGLYQISPTPYASDLVKCEMMSDGGGWQAFFSGANGSPNRFAGFESNVESCTSVSTRCLRRLPSWATTSSTYAARCGDAMVKFTIGSAVHGFFASGIPDGWQAIGASSAIAGSVTHLPTQIWTGQSGNTSFILGLGHNTQSQTFMSSYSNNAGWDSCNSVSNTGTAIDLYVRP